MPTLVWIVLAGSAMTALALSGSLTFILPDRIFDRIVLPLVALAAGSLVGGALFHMLPESVSALGNSLGVYVWLAAGLLAFLILEQYLHWHHCHRPVSAHRPVGYLILVADALHNLIGGLAIGAAFVTDIRLGIVTWLVAAAHEIPQEMGDFGILVHSGWSRGRALVWNVVSASTVLLGALAAYALSGHLDVAVLIPFAAGNFIYIALADLVPELTTKPAAHDKAIHTIGFCAGLALLLGVAVAT
ncbi:ZIP family metal transporter [Micromonospora halophytica]|uniref:Zinc and cadmium transporter n=1 Tax=Micromonospora halophytica TaxID=47864 RepID=A0A1C5GZI9_9ACTN|nr:ZIP family metal transporter [Micromonospora halophytica]SCG39222.1 zinc and cadmium transporter [Micromonospora halophytica]